MRTRYVIALNVIAVLTLVVLAPVRAQDVQVQRGYVLPVTVAMETCSSIREGQLQQAEYWFNSTCRMGFSNNGGNTLFGQIVCHLQYYGMVHQINQEYALCSAGRSGGDRIVGR